LQDIRKIRLIEALVDRNFFACSESDERCEGFCLDFA